MSKYGRALSDYPDAESKLVVSNASAPYLVSDATSVAAMRFISAMSTAEMALTRATARAMKVDYAAVAALLNKVRAASAREEMQTSAAREALSDQPELWAAYVRAKQPLGELRELRNRFAHYIWASLPEDRDLVALIAPKRLIVGATAQRTFVDEARANPESPNRHKIRDGSQYLIGPLPKAYDPEDVRVYSLSDLKDALASAQITTNHLGLLEQLLSDEGNIPAGARATLLDSIKAGR